MFFSLNQGSFTMPVCYHPTTVLAVDDDVDFLETLSFTVSNEIALLCFDKPEKVLEYAKSRQPHLPFTSRCLIDQNGMVRFDLMAIRNEIYNNNRFKEIIISVTDYDMPYITGLDLIRSLEFPTEISQYAHVFLTGKISVDFKEKLKELGIHEEYIGKDDPDYIDKLLNMVDKKTMNIFQRYSYLPARVLSRDPQQRVNFLFDGHFAKVLSDHVQKEQICEMYLFDKQGSYLFLDKQGKLSWFFIRNEQGIENTIRLATEYQAPASVIQALKSKKVILSIYEKEDFDSKKTINWDDYLLPATLFESDNAYLTMFSDLIPLVDGKKTAPTYYYAFTNTFPDHGIQEKKIMSYESFLEDEN